MHYYMQRILTSHKHQIFFNRILHSLALLFSPLGFRIYGRIPTLPVQLIGWLWVLLHELDIVHIQGRGEPNSVRQEDEEDAGDDGQDEREREETTISELKELKC